MIASEIYAAREPQQPFSSEAVVKAMHHPSARFIPSLEEIRKYLLDHLQTGDVVLVLSAGDAVQVSTEVLTGIQER